MSEDFILETDWKINNVHIITFCWCDYYFVVDANYHYYPKDFFFTKSCLKSLPNYCKFCYSAETFSLLSVIIL